MESVSDGWDVARVRAVADEGKIVYLDLRDGKTATLSSNSPVPLSPGQVILLDVENSLWQDAPPSLWPDASAVGVIRLVLDDLTVIDSGARLQLVPTIDSIAYSKGNTVVFDSVAGVRRILHEEPIKLIDLPLVDEGAVNKYKVDAADGDPETFDDVGGLREPLRRAEELIEIPLKFGDALTEIGAKPIKGVLFTGPPGTGKTMLARIISRRAEATFYKISGPEIFSKWYGQSEEIIRAIFEDAAAQERAIVFFDEIDSVAGQRAEESHEASRRVVAQLLASMDGFKGSDQVIVIATTNRPQDIDVALRRPGRFDWEIHFDLPDRRDREEILEASSRRLKTVPRLPHDEIADRTESWSAAELAAIWSEAALAAVVDGRAEIGEEDYYAGFERVSRQRLRSGRKDQNVS